MTIPIRKNTLAKDMMHSQLTFGKLVIDRMLRTLDNFKPSKYKDTGKK